MVGFCTEQLAKEVFHGFGVIDVIPNCIFHVVPRLHNAFPCRLIAFNIVMLAGGSGEAFDNWGILHANKMINDSTKCAILVVCFTR